MMEHTRFRFLTRWLLPVIANVFAPATFASGSENVELSGRVIAGVRAAVVCVSPPAAEVGSRILRTGGNAVDAAVATAFALAVTWPEAGNIGGGGYLVMVPTGVRTPLAVDFREVAPAAATPDMFVKPEGRTAHRRVGVPGTVAGLFLAHQRAGKLPWKQLISPAMRLAREGFVLDAATAASLNSELRRPQSKSFTEFQRVYGRRGGGDWHRGDRLVQSDLAATLARIAERGADGFYAGETADRIVAEMRRGGGLITREDLARYRALVRQPVHSTYRGYDVYSAPLSSSGGTVLAEMLNILENFHLEQNGRWSPDTLHLMAESMRRAYRDRAGYLGDPEFNVIPTRLLTKDYARKLAASIDWLRSTPSAELGAEIPIVEESSHTTHLSVMDADRTAVSLTYTLESLYGSRVVVPGAGFLLNDEMNDFGWLPGVTDTSGRIGTPPNQVAPRKRMLSSMTPTILTQGGNPVLVTGSPGGRTIINTVLCMIVNVVDFHMTPMEAVAAPRLHHQWFPDRIVVESKLAREHPQAIAGLRMLGHQVAEESSQGDAHTIAFDAESGRITATADTREDGWAAGYGMK